MHEPSQERLKAIETMPPSRKFLAYLFGIPTFKGGPENFPDAIDAAYFEKSLRDLAALRPRARDGEEAEASMTAYWDETAKTMKTPLRTDLLHGEVNSAIVEILKSGNSPLLDAHTHPSGIQRLPSVMDYFQLLQGDPASRWRVIRAITILNPNSQILAVATDTTPILYPEDCGAYCKPRLEKELSKDALMRQSLRRGERIIRVTREMVQRAAAQHKAEGKFDPSEAQAIIAKSLRLNAKEAALTEQELERTRVTMNETQRAFPQETNIKLYESSDFRNFVTIDLSQIAPTTL